MGMGYCISNNWGKLSLTFPPRSSSLLSSSNPSFSKPNILNPFGVKQKFASFSSQQCLSRLISRGKSGIQCSYREPEVTATRASSIATPMVEELSKAFKVGKRKVLKKILILGAGPIAIGQACEFDYSGTLACKAFREEGHEINSNPATIMTDPDMADRTCITPMTPDLVEQVLGKERPDALLPTMGGQTALNLAVALAESGALEKYGVELIGAKLDVIKKAEDRDLFKQAMKNIVIQTPPSGIGTTLEECFRIANENG